MVTEAQIRSFLLSYRNKYCNNQMGYVKKWWHLQNKPEN